ncbi:MAG TPA: glycosyltransferase family 39 protein [Tepidisphaeraceae bacterium]|jgi:hypothetical protein
MTQPPAIAPSSRSGFFTKSVCRTIFIVLMLAGALIHIRYLTHNCPLGLSEDEAHYWDWSRQLGLSYYSKGPLVAYIIRFSCAIFGNTMPAVRYPATLLAIATASITYWLIVELFGSDPLALGWTLLSHTIPLYVAGSLLMTIDSPFFFCWALATVLAAKAIFQNRQRLWPFVGIAVGVGFLAKYTMFVWPVCLIPFLIADPSSRRILRSGWFWLAFPIALLFTTPVIIFNAQHNWITVHHVQADTSAGFSWTNLPAFLLGQAAIIGLFNFLILLGAVAYIFRESKTDPHRRAIIYLASIGLTFFAIVACTAFTTRVEPNWPACAYFTLIILCAYFLSRRLWSGPHKKWWRICVAGSVVLAGMIVPLAHNFEILYPVLTRALPTINRVMFACGAKHPKTLSNFDPTYKLRGWPTLGDRVAYYLNQHPGAMVMGEDYQIASEVAFYTPGQPKTYAVGSYFTPHAKRMSQFDIWSDRSLAPTNSTLLGRDAIYVGDMNPALRNSFTSAQRLPEVQISVNGYPLRSFTIWYCHDFHGMSRSAPQEF